MVKEKLLVSACFVASGYKYDGGDNIQEAILQLQEKYDFVLICPEVFGGLETPRLPSEQRGEKVVMIDGKDVTANFVKGAKKALELALANNVKKALLKAKSPSCGSGVIYDGTFSHTKIAGDGVAAKMLKEAGIKVYTEEEIAKL